MYGKIKSGQYRIGNRSIYFRSRWEANYALYLDFLKRQGQIDRWEFEPDVFVFEKIKFGTRSYKPDFKVIDNRENVEYHEVKGYWDRKSKTKIKRMAKYFPEIKIVIIDASSYRDIKKKVGRMLRFY